MGMAHLFLIFYSHPVTVGTQDPLLLREENKEEEERKKERKEGTQGREEEAELMGAWAFPFGGINSVQSSPVQSSPTRPVSVLLLHEYMSYIGCT
jgi:hypothetical protein